MTTIASFISVSKAGKMTLSMISDSRISWSDPLNPSLVLRKYDYSQKVFRLNTTPDVLGYCGDSMFCLINLSQIFSYLMHAKDFTHAKNITDKKNIIYQLLSDSLTHYPPEEICQNFRIYWNSIFQNEFYVHKFSYNKNSQSFTIDPIPVPASTGLVFRDGSGEDFYEAKYTSYGYNDSPVSRIYFKALADVIEDQSDPKTGGPPQMVSLRLTENDIQSVSVLFKDKYYLHGVHDIFSSDTLNVEFRDCDFNFLTPDGKVRNNYKGSFGAK